MAADFTIYKSALNESHAGLYWYIKPTRLDAEFKLVEKAIARPLQKNNFFKLLLRLTAGLKHGHSFLVNNQVYGVNYMLRDLIPDQRYLPFTVSIISNKLYVAINCSNDAKLAAGSQILSINGKTVDKLLHEFHRYVPADGGNIGYKNFRLEKFGFHYLYQLLYPKEAAYKVTFKKPGAFANQNSNITAIRPDELEERFKTLMGRPINYFPRSLEYKVLNKSNSVCYLKVSSFYEGLTNRNGMEFTRFMDSSFNKIATNKIKKLIIDLRDNEGGNDMLAILLFSYLAEKPFSQGSPTYLKSDRLSVLPYIETPDEEIIRFAANPGLFEDKIGNEYILKKQFDEISYDLFRPKEPVFNGTTVILTNGGSFSATSRFVNLADHYLRNGKRVVRFAGTNYGGNDSFGFATGGEEVSVILPNSHIRLSIPIKGLTRLKSGKPGTMIILDKRIDPQPNDLLKGTDSQLKKTIQYINKL